MLAGDTRERFASSDLNVISKFSRKYCDCRMYLLMALRSMFRSCATPATPTLPVYRKVWTLPESAATAIEGDGTGMGSPPRGLVRVAYQRRPLFLGALFRTR